jgi:DNA-binding MarR family transcriptional regulator
MSKRTKDRASLRRSDDGTVTAPRRGTRAAKDTHEEAGEAADALPVPYVTTLLVRDTCLCLHLQRAARATARHFDDLLRPLGLTNGQFSLLMSLNRPVPAGMGGVASLLAMDRTTLTAALAPLKRRGLVNVAPDPDDRRGRLLTLTAAGRTLLARATPVWTQNHARLEDTIGTSAAHVLRAQLLTLSKIPVRTAPSP